MARWARSVHICTLTCGIDRRLLKRIRVTYCRGKEDAGFTFAASAADGTLGGAGRELAREERDDVVVVVRVGHGEEVVVVGREGMGVRAEAVERRGWVLGRGRGLIVGRGTLEAEGEIGRGGSLSLDMWVEHPQPTFPPPPSYICSGSSCPRTTRSPSIADPHSIFTLHTPPARLTDLILQSPYSTTAAFPESRTSSRDASHLRLVHHSAEPGSFFQHQP